LLSKLTDEISGWSVPESLWFMERYNGFGYRGRGQGTTPPKRTPYLWSFTNHYVKGKFVRDSVFDPNAVSRQAGAAAILQRLQQEIGSGILLGDDSDSRIPMLDHLLFQGARGADVITLQMRLRDRGHSPGEIDGQFGPKTRGAVLSFQREAGVVQDGVVGPVTWGKLWLDGSVTRDAGETGGTVTTMAEPNLRQQILDIAGREAAKGRSHAPGNEIDRLVLDPLRPILMELGHLGRSHTDSFFNWCAAWVTYICREGGISIPDRFGDFYASVALVDAWRHMGRETGAWFRRDERTPRPGDIVTFNWDGDSDLDHIGIMKAFGPDLTILTYEGNKGNREGEFTRSLTRVDGFLDLDRLAERLGPHTG
jgi:hypothetical protein